MPVLRQSTQVIVRVGSFADSIDGVTPETGITLGAADQAEALKAAGAATEDISGNTWAAVTGSDGWYNLTLTTTNTNTVGDLTIVVQDSSVCCPVKLECVVIEEAVYDQLYAASAPGAATVAQATAIQADTDDIQTRLPAALSGGLMPCDAQAISTDTVAADRLETMLDGTGGNVLTLAQLRINSAAAGGAIDIDNSAGPGISIGSTDHGIDIDSSTGNGIDILADGPGIRVESDGSGDGISITGASGGHGMRIQAGAGADGIFAQGGTGSGNGITAQSQAGNSSGLIAQGTGTGAGLRAQNGGTGPGLVCQGGPTNGDGAHFLGSPTNAGDGIFAQGGLTGGAGARLQGVVDSGLVCGGDQASAIFAQGTINGHGVEIIGGVNGHGIYALGGNNVGDGIRAEADTAGKGINAIGAGAHAGIESVGGATGHGISALGGATSGDGIHAEADTLGDGIEVVGAGGGFDINADIQGSLSGDVGGDVQGNVDGNLGGTLSIAALAQINAEADTALTDIRLDELIQNAASPTTPTINSFLDRVTSTDGTQTYDRATDSLQSIRDALTGAGPTAAQIADAVWDEALADHVAAGSMGFNQNLIDNVPADTSAAVTAAHGVGSYVDSGTPPTVGAIADAVWDEAIAGHLAAGSTGEALNNAGSGASAAVIADAVWDEALADHVAAGSMGFNQNLIDNVPADVDTQLSGVHGAGNWEGGGAAPTVAQIVDGVWDEQNALHLSPGSTGESLNDAASGGAGLTPQQVADALKLAPAAGAPASGSVYAELADIETCACSGGGSGGGGINIEGI